MSKTANNKASDFTTFQEPFKGNQLFAEKKGDLYVVYSYGYHFPLYVHCNGTWHKNTDKYSSTTSKHATQSVPRNNGGFIGLNTTLLKALIADVEAGKR